MHNNTGTSLLLKWSNLCPWDAYNLLKDIIINTCIYESLIWSWIGLSDRCTWDHWRFLMWFVLFNLKFSMICFVYWYLSFFVFCIVPWHSQFVLDLRVWISLLYHLHPLYIDIAIMKIHSFKHLIPVPVSISGIFTLIAKEVLAWVIANKLPLDFSINH